MDKNDETEPKVQNFSELFDKFGKYQVVQSLLVCLPSLFVAMMNVAFIFIAGDLEYRCKIPECEESGLVTLPVWWPNKTIDKCSRPVMDTRFDNKTCTNSSFSKSIDVCTEWIYENNNTIVAELNLACQPWNISLIGVVHSIGMLFSMLVAGWMADRFGRKPTIIFCAVGSTLGYLKSFATSYYMFIPFEFLEAFISGGIYPVTSVILIEIGSKWSRVLSGVIFSYALYLGESVLAGITMTVPYWKNIVQILYLPPILFVSYIFLVEESPKWQILNSKTDAAKRVLAKIAHINRLHINKQYLRDLDATELRKQFNLDKQEVREGFKEICSSREILKRLLVACICMFVVGFVYYGLMINSVFLPGDKYMNFLLMALMSFPGELIALYFMNKVGRKVPLIVGYLVCGVICVASPYVSVLWIKISLFMLGKMAISACFTGVVTYIMELFPTSARGTLSGLGAVASRLGTVTATLTPMLVPISAVLPSMLFGISVLMAAASIFFTPETKDQPLMDTIEQVENSVEVTKSGRQEHA